MTFITEFVYMYVFRSRTWVIRAIKIRTFVLENT